MSQYHTEARRALLLLYDVVIGLAITKGLERLFTQSDVFALPSLGKSLLFVALVSYIFRFFLGSHKVMARDIELEVRTGKLIIDVVMLLGQAVGFFVCALCFENIVFMRWVIISILAFEVVWLLIMFALFRVRGKTERQWVIHDIVMVVVLTLCAIEGSFNIWPLVSAAWFFVIVSIVAALLDLLINRDFYFPRAGRRLRIFVAGPYGDDNPKDVIEENIRRAEEIGKLLALKGHIPFIPHTMLSSWESDKRFSIADFKQIDNEWLEQCDALYYISSSPGADAERGIAANRGLRVFDSIDQVPQFGKGDPNSSLRVEAMK